MSKYTKAKRQFIYNRDGGRCHYCRCYVTFAEKRGPRMATFDHVIPRSKGGLEASDNLVLCCSPCNHDRGSMDYDEFLELKSRGISARAYVREKYQLIYGHKKPADLISENA